MADELTITAGLPFTQHIRFKNVKSVWADISQLEVKAHLRTEPSGSGHLISDLRSFMTPSFDGDDLVVIWVMTGEQTRDLYGQRWGYNKTGYFDIVLSDLGNIDARALKTPILELKCQSMVTTNEVDSHV